MILFIFTPVRHYEISDAYVIALTFIIIFLVTKIIKQMLKKLKFLILVEEIMKLNFLTTLN